MIAVHAARVRLEQVRINLRQNAAEARRGTDGARVTLLAHGDGPVLIDICDNGPGVPADILPQLFTPFVTGRPDGLGLGLAIASDIMRGFGGTLRSEEHTSELQSLMRISYAVFCLKKKKKTQITKHQK